MTTEKILLTGCRGQLGFELTRSLSLLGDLYAFDKTDFDLEDIDGMREIVRKVSPQVIVNAGAFTKVDLAEDRVDKVHQINAIAPEVLANEANSLGAMLVHYSTDYVFDGLKEGPYHELDKTSPLNVYGASKAAGEQAVIDNCSRYLILRTSWVIGSYGSNFIKTILKLGGQRDFLKVVADQVGAPTSAALLSDLTAHLVKRALNKQTTFPYGLYHAAATGHTSWHSFARHIVHQARTLGHPIKITPDSIFPISTAEYPTAARRPANSVLDSTKLRETFGLAMPNWKVSADHILRQIL